MAREILSWYVPSVPVDEQLIQNIQKLMLVGASPSGVIALERMNFDLDTRSVLPIINVPTLVMHREEDGGVLVEEGRYLAQHIPNARMVELQGNDHLHSVGDSNSILDEIEEFLTGVRDPLERNRVLATVMFTDIVGSTEHVLELGDRRWRELLDQHHALVRMQLSRFHGHEVDTTGDGFFATFDGPARAIRCAVSISDGMQPVGLQIRVGLHAGECELMDKKVSGIAVHIGARVMAHSGANEVLVSSTLKDLVAGSGITFEERGVHDLKGVPGKWQLYAVTREREQL
jgi:class 3 adenylate cyclase